MIYLYLLRKQKIVFLTVLFVFTNTIFLDAQWLPTGNSITTGQFLGTTNNEPLIFKVNNQEKLRITPTGRLIFSTPVYLSMYLGGGNDIIDVKAINNTGLGFVHFLKLRVELLILHLVRYL